VLALSLDSARPKSLVFAGSHDISNGYVPGDGSQRLPRWWTRISGYPFGLSQSPRRLPVSAMVMFPLSEVNLIDPV
jgi:hypothetical protein